MTASFIKSNTPAQLTLHHLLGVKAVGKGKGMHLLMQQHSAGLFHKPGQPTFARMNSLHLLPPHSNMMLTHSLGLLNS